jgi:hypothetical protein
MAAPSYPEFLVAWVQSQADLAALLGSPGELRVSPQQAHRKSGTPRVEHYLVSGDRVRGLKGPLGVTRQRWTLNVWGGSMAEAKAVARMITGDPDGGDQRLDGYRGTLAGVTVKMTVLLDESEVFEPLTPGDDLGTPGMQLDFDVAYNT